MKLLSVVLGPPIRHPKTTLSGLSPSKVFFSTFFFFTTAHFAHETRGGGTRWKTERRRENLCCFLICNPYIPSMAFTMADSHWNNNSLQIESIHFLCYSHTEETTLQESTLYMVHLCLLRIIFKSFTLKQKLLFPLLKPQLQTQAGK